MERRLFSEPGLKVIFLRDASTRKGRQFRTRTSLVKLKIAPYELPRRDTIHAFILSNSLDWKRDISRKGSEFLSVRACK